MKKKISKSDYLKLEGLKALFLAAYAKCEDYCTCFGELLNLPGADIYDKGSYILWDNCGSDFNLEVELNSVGVEIVVKKVKQNEK